MPVDMSAIITEATCGAACWYAREEICRCSCGGKNHGVLKEGCKGEQPIRTKRIKGFMYELLAVEAADGEYKTRTERPLYDLRKEVTNRAIKAGVYRQTYRESPGEPVKLKTATPMEVIQWKELHGWREKITFDRPLVAWIRVDMKEFVEG